MLWIIVMFLSDSYSDGTHSLQGMQYTGLLHIRLCTAEVAQKKHLHKIFNVAQKCHECIYTALTMACIHNI